MQGLHNELSNLFSGFLIDKRNTVSRDLLRVKKKNRAAPKYGPARFGYSFGIPDDHLF